MVEEQDTVNDKRRNVLKTVAGGAFAGAFVGKSAVADESPEARYDFMASKRGTFQRPVTENGIVQARRAAIEKYADTNGQLDGFVLTDLDRGADTAIVGYNIVLTPEGIPREQFFERKIAGERKRASESISRNDQPGSARLRERADDVLDATVASIQSNTVSTSGDVSTSDTSEVDWYSCNSGDTCLGELETLGTTDVWKEYEDTNSGHADLRGDVNFQNGIFYDSENHRGVSQSWLRMQAGRMLCVDHGLDAYCDQDGVWGDGWQNKGAKWVQNWDSGLNPYPTDDEGIVDDISPRGQLEDEVGSDTTSVTIGATYDGDPGVGGEIGWSRSLQFPSSRIYDKTDLNPDRGALESLHEWDLQYDSSGARNVAEADAACLARADLSCPDNLDETFDVCEIDVTVEHGWPNILGSWQITESNTERFTYTYHCHCSTYPCYT